MTAGSDGPSNSKKQLSARAAFWRKIFNDLVIMTVIGAFLAVIGPFGSIEQSLAVRLVSWLGFAYLGYAIYSPMAYFVDRAHNALALPHVPLWIAAALIATIPLTVAIHTIQNLPGWPPALSLEQALTSYFYVFVIGGAITLLFYVLEARSKTDSDEQTPPTVPVEVDDDPSKAVSISNALLDQLSSHLGSQIIALEMEDHYVRVHTNLGSELVLMRLRDAIAHLSDFDGRQVHRSWWVARGAVEDVKREGRNIRLVLKGGLEAPVSRAQASELKQAGWI